MLKVGASGTSSLTVQAPFSADEYKCPSGEVTKANWNCHSLRDSTNDKFKVTQFSSPADCRVRSAKEEKYTQYSATLHCNDYSNGGLIKQDANSPNSADCEAQCNRNAGCKFYTFYDKTTWCSLFKTCTLGTHPHQPKTYQRDTPTCLHQVTAKRTDSTAGWGMALGVTCCAPAATCTCAANGTPATGASCTRNNGRICGSCNAGFQREAETTFAQISGAAPFTYAHCNNYPDNACKTHAHQKGCGPSAGNKKLDADADSPNVQKCEDECRKNAQCTHFTFYDNYKFRFNGCPRADAVISSGKQQICAASHTFSAGPNWPTGSTDAQSKAACAAECLKRSSCTHYVWFSDRGCRTYNSCATTKNWNGDGALSIIEIGGGLVLAQTCMLRCRRLM